MTRKGGALCLCWVQCCRLQSGGILQFKKSLYHHHDLLQDHLSDVLIILSDREYLAWEHREEMDRQADRARKMLEAGNGEDVCCRLHPMGGAPVTASRLLSLYQRGGGDDFFSSDLRCEGKV